MLWPEASTTIKQVLLFFNVFILFMLSHSHSQGNTVIFTLFLMYRLDCDQIQAKLECERV